MNGRMVTSELCLWSLTLSLIVFLILVQESVHFSPTLSHRLYEIRLMCAFSSVSISIRQSQSVALSITISLTLSILVCATQHVTFFPIHTAVPQTSNDPLPSVPSAELSTSLSIYCFHTLNLRISVRHSVCLFASQSTHFPLSFSNSLNPSWDISPTLSHSLYSFLYYCSTLPPESLTITLSNHASHTRTIHQ